MTTRPRILFIAEAVTLAHVARSFTLAKSLDLTEYDIHFAQSPQFSHLLGEIPFHQHEIWSISPEQFMEALDKGQTLYSLDTLTRYVEEDRKLIQEVEPDIVVGDFRLSLATSSELEGIPYVTVSNACWSPYTRQRYPVPELPLTRVLGPTLGQWVFSLGRPVAFALHCLPMHFLRRQFGLTSLGFDLRKVYTHADMTLYADIPGLYRMKDLPGNHRFIGPVKWSPALPLPAWWQELPNHRPIIYVTLGSSGQAGLLPAVIAALGQLEITALVSTAGVEMSGQLPSNIFWEKYLPGEEAVKLASLVVCNGGSPTTHQAFSWGVPVLGLAGNLDQYLNMATIEQAGAGRLLRSGMCTSANLAHAIVQMMEDSTAREAAQKLAKYILDSDSLGEFNRLIKDVSVKSHLAPDVRSRELNLWDDTGKTRS